MYRWLPYDVSYLIISQIFKLLYLQKITSYRWSEETYGDTDGFRFVCCDDNDSCFDYDDNYENENCSKGWLELGRDFIISLYTQGGFDMNALWSLTFQHQSDFIGNM